MVWGEYSLKQILEIGDASAKDQAIPYKPEKTGGAIVIEKVMKYDEWYDALEDPALKDTLIRSYSNLRGLFEDLKVAKDRQSNVGERLVQFGKEKGFPEQRIFRNYRFPDSSYSTRPVSVSTPF